MSSQLRREHGRQPVMLAVQELLADSSSGWNLLVLTDAAGEILWRWAARRHWGGQTCWSSAGL